ncbi:hypothetical protein HIM_09423 [Hirsutella minnesotensis 3608]|uniref:Cytochrome P450 n=1 Tax=Hirsutella minnesotensis 3608 TaxID=1043627 RepID=A0A0F7ZSD4_9HYPO|nr:hypothetical protein HIM_09423 [Hirsutella minnesotensis 3608]
MAVDLAHLPVGKMSILLLLIAIAAFAIQHHLKAPRLPPGPRGLPVIGNIHQISRRYSWKQFQKWHAIYGPVFSLQLGQITLILLGNHEVTKDLLEKRSALYSSRPPLAVAADCVAKNFGAALLPYGPRWRQFHKIQLSLLNSRKSRLYQPVQDLESRQLLYNLLSTNNFEHQLYRFSSSLIFMLLYGQRFSKGDEPDLLETEHLASSALEVVSFGNWIVDIFPVLNYLPRCLARWKRMGDNFHERRAELYERNAANALSTRSWNWTKQTCIHEVHPVSRKELTFLLGELYETASHTTAGALTVAILAAVMYPDAVKRVQAELEQTVGGRRLPDFNDLSLLPLTKSFVMEVLRWRPLAPGGIPHSPTKDDVYRGFLIPKGAIVNASNWTLEMNDSIFHDADDFIPERWIENPDLPKSAFGYGRRICPGQHLARNTLFLTVARLLWAFDIQCTDKERLNLANLEMTHEGIFSKPSTFPAKFVVRSQMHEQVVRRGWSEGDDNVDHILGDIGQRFSNA